MQIVALYYSRGGNTRKLARTKGSKKMGSSWAGESQNL
jgi:hypothetical protein